jgi:hypothetical protein
LSSGIRMHCCIAAQTNIQQRPICS